MDASKPAALRFLRILLFSLALHIGLLWQPVAAQDVGLSEAGLAIANAINQVRVDNGLEPLAVHPLLNQAAQGHVNDMIANYVYGHYGSDGSTVSMRVARTGYSDKPWVSENWVSSGSTAGAMRWWMNDYIHRVNILTPRWREVGVGVGTRGSEMIFVTVFSAGVGAEGEAVKLEVAATPPPPSVRIEQESVPTGGLDYTIRSGDTLLAVGLRYGVPWETLAAANGLNETSLLQIGQVLHIPGRDEVALAAAPVPDVPTEPYTVQSGDTLFSIAGHRGMSWQELAALNQLGEHSLLQIGQEIKVPASEAPADEGVEDESAEDADAAAENSSDDQAAASVAQASAAQEAPTQEPPAEEASAEEPATEEPTSEESAPEEAPAEIDSRAAALAAVPVTAPATTSASEVALASVAAAAPGPSGASASIAAVAPGPSGSSPAPSAEGGEYYTIAEGDTIFTVAVAQGLDWQQLMALNNLTEESLLQPGQQIRLR